MSNYLKVNTRMSDTTLFLTSCKRHDLLKVCLETFVKHNTYPIEHGIIVEDSDMDLEWIREILPFKRLDLINTAGRQGQLANIDRYYPLIQTPYVFHCEDDFVFIRDSFIEPSKRILEEDDSCINVWLTEYDPAWESTSQDPTNLTNHARILPPYHRQFQLDDITFWPVANVMHGEWALGFTFQPSLHRVEDWSRYGGYGSIIDHVAPWCNKMDGAQVERNLCRHYIMEGFHTFMLAGPGDKQDGYVNTTGHQRHVEIVNKGTT
jgi:hypothetical protein